MIYKYILNIFNFLLLSFFILVEDFENIEIFKYLIISVLIYTFIVFLLKYRNIFSETVSNVDLVLLSSLTMLVFFEVLFKFIPTVFPSLLINYAGNSSLQGENKSVIDYYEESPFARFKPNTIITSAGDYGSPDKFEYQWRTDRLGFKNLESVANRKDIQILAVGDSFTEGMGVKVESTYPSILTKFGLPTYNLGVQGSAPVQWTGYLKLVAKEFKPKLVVVGYLPTVYERESTFLKRNSNDSSLPSALGRISKANKKFEIRKKKKFLTSGLMVFLSFNLIPDLKDFIRPIINNFDTNLTYDPRYISTSKLVVSEKIRISKMARYIKEFKRAEEKGLTKEEIATTPEWRSLENQILQMRSISQGLGAMFLLVCLPHRDIAYYEAATGNTLPSYNFSKLEIELMSEFARKNKIETLDVTPVFIEYSKSLSEESAMQDFPYLELDGHLNDKGNHLLAETLKNFIQKTSLLK